MVFVTIDQASSDSHIALAVMFDVPAGQDANPHKKNFYAKAKSGTKELLYYGFANAGNKILCRERYKSAAGFLAHVNEVKDELEGLIKQVGKDQAPHGWSSYHKVCRTRLWSSFDERPSFRLFGFSYHNSSRIHSSRGQASGVSQWI